MICVQNMCVEPITSLNPIMKEFVLRFVAPVGNLSSITQRPYTIFIIYHYHVFYLGIMKHRKTGVSSGSMLLRCVPLFNAFSLFVPHVHILKFRLATPLHVIEIIISTK